MWKWLKQFAGGGPSAKSARNTIDKVTLSDPETISAFKALSQDLRARKPVCPVSGGGVLLLTSEDVKAAFFNRDLSNQPSRFSALAPKNKEKFEAASVAYNILPFLDAPRHVALRQWAGSAFFKYLKTFENQIPTIAVSHCRRLNAGHSHLLVETIARDFVVDVMGKFIGTDLTPEEMKRYTSALFRLFAPAADTEAFSKTNEGLKHARSALAQALKERRADKSPCFMLALDGTFPTDLAHDERDLIIIDTALLFLADGVENVEAAIGVVMMCYAQTPASITPDFVRRAIAADTPGQTIARIARKDMLIGDELVNAGTPVFLSLASANDGANGTAEFTFGRGRHKCIGEHLAINMITAMCHELTERHPVIDASSMNYRAMFGHKWPRGVTITLKM